MFLLVPNLRTVYHIRIYTGIDTILSLYLLFVGVYYTY